MKWLVILLIVPIISCTNGASTENIKDSTDSAGSNGARTTAHDLTHDSVNLIYSKDLQKKTMALIGLWTLKALHMIDKNGNASEFQQASTKIEFREDHKMISTVDQIVAESRWDYDNTKNLLTTILEEINGSKSDLNVKQENKIIYLSNDSLIYRFNDPVTGYVLEMQYHK